MMTVDRLALLASLTVALALGDVAAAAAPTPADGIRYVEAKALAPDGHAMYLESHWTYSDHGNPSRLVLYRCPDGKPFARKTLADDGNAQAPDFELEDARSGYREGVRRAGNQRIVFVKRDANSAEHTATLKTSPMPVIDAGFDAYIRNHWDTLGTNGSESLPFLVPSRLSALNLSVKREADTHISGREARQYRLGLDSFISFALPHLSVAYDARTRELLSFSGFVNIRSSTGKNVTANVEFDPATSRDASSAERVAAASAPLNGRCAIP